MKISEILNKPTPSLSFEVFPPKTEEGRQSLLAELLKLEEFEPAFISVTYGAGGKNQDGSTDLIKLLGSKLKASIVPHLTCVGSSPDSITAFLKQVQAYGADSVLALRGDFPQQSDYSAESNYFKHASDLIDFAKNSFDMDIAVAAFPEIHPESAGLADDIKYLKLKQDKGAVAAITQLFFDNKLYLDFVKQAREAGVTIPIIPGIMPIVNARQLERIPDFADSVIPDDLQNQLDLAKNDEELAMVGKAHAIAQIEELMINDAPGVHLYILNKADAAQDILRRLRW